MKDLIPGILIGAAILALAIPLAVPSCNFTLSPSIFGPRTPREPRKPIFPRHKHVAPPEPGSPISPELIPAGAALKTPHASWALPAA